MIIIPDIKKQFEGIFPKDYKNTFPYWGFFTKEEIEANKGRLLMLDIDLGRYCSLSCSTCFRKSSSLDELREGDITYEELLKVIDDAKKLGLQSVKLCGAGEPTENTRFLQFVRDMSERNIGIAAFTKGQVLGSDEETKRFNGKYGITNAKQLCKELFKYKISFMLGFQSFDRNIQDKIVGKQGHTLIRNKALENLVNAGFNNENPTRLCLCNAPLTQKTYNDAFSIYTYARERNLYPILSLSMTSGKQFSLEFLNDIDLTKKQKVELFTNIYSWNIEQRIQTIEKIKQEGISSMPGSHPCNQVACGLYITANGTVVGCPGFTYDQGNIKDINIQEIWNRSQNKSLRVGKFNCGCPPKENTTVPLSLYQEVLNNLLAL